MTEHLLERAREIAPDVPEQESALLIVAHGTSLNDNSAVAAKKQVEKIRELGRYSEVLNVYMEEMPLVSDWANLTASKNVIVVPFFISDGLHSDEDIPLLLGIDSTRDGFGRRIQGRSLFYSTAIGTDARFADVIIEQAMAFDRKQIFQPAS
jgi:sirohydrochlorin cobaltochelatase